ncbi:hypothetical protein [Salmonella phage vB_SalS_TU03]|nr:hypothetical protein [Salmonella phage vB_SalS_TU03]
MRMCYPLKKPLNCGFCRGRDSLVQLSCDTLSALGGRILAP